VDDINEVIKKAEHYRFEDEESKVFLNSISALPTSKKRLKKSIIERMEMLIIAYTTLATFVPDETIEYLEQHPEDMKKVYLDMLDDMEKFEKEIIKKICHRQKK